MTAGIQIFNDSGTILFDENFNNLAVRSSGTVTVSTYGDVATFKISNCTSPMVALRAAGKARAETWFDADGTTLNVYIAGAPGLQVTWFLFDRVVSAANWGLVVYRADGTVAFDGTKQYTRIVDVWSGSSFTSGVGTRNYSSGRSYATVSMKYGLYRHIQSDPDPGAPDNGNTFGYVNTTTEQLTTISWSGTSLTVGSESRSYSTPGPKGVYVIANSSPSWVIAVLDVTGY